jgi:hypothetical protein
MSMPRHGTTSVSYFKCSGLSWHWSVMNPGNYIPLGRMKKLNKNKEGFYYVGINMSSVLVMFQNDHTEDFFEHTVDEFFYYSDVLNFETRIYATV